MSADVPSRYRAIAAAYLAKVDGVPAGAWQARTPCAEWDVRDLVAHSVAVHKRMLARLDGTEPPGIEPEPAREGEDLPAEIRALSARVQAALDDPAVRARVVDSPAGPMPFEELAGTLLCADTLVHVWDLARASGQDESLDPAEVAATLAFMEPRDEFMRRPGGFGPKLEIPAGVDEQTRLLLFCGRRV